MTKNTRALLLCSLALGLFKTTAWAQETLTPSSMKWGISAGWNQYKEPGLMQLSGPETGVHGQINTENNLQFEGEILFGRQHYDSTQSGSMDNVGNIQSAWRLLTPVLGDRHNGLSVGAAYQTLWNDMRGTSTYHGTTYGGYQRMARQLWLPARWNINDVWQLDMGLLIYGRHTSNLSEVNSTYSDVTNTQRHGHYIQASATVAMDAMHALTPYARYTHLADSNTVWMGGKGWYEPASDRWQVGVIWEFTGY